MIGESIYCSGLSSLLALYNSPNLPFALHALKVFSNKSKMNNYDSQSIN